MLASGVASTWNGDLLTAVPSNSSDPPSIFDTTESRRLMSQTQIPERVAIPLGAHGSLKVLRYRGLNHGGCIVNLFYVLCRVL